MIILSILLGSLPFTHAKRMTTQPQLWIDKVVKFRASFISRRWWWSFHCFYVETLEISRNDACVVSIYFLPCLSILWYSTLNLTEYIIFYRGTTQQPRLQIRQIFANSFISYSRSMSGITFLNLRINNWIPQKVGIYKIQNS